MNIKKFLKVALGTGLIMLDQSDRTRVKERVSDHVDDLQELANEHYETAAQRVARASRALRQENSSSAWNILRFVAGVGVGIGVGMLVAPEKGDKTRAKLAERAQEVGENVRQRFAGVNAPATALGD
jgi:gas vesicle protein